MYIFKTKLPEEDYQIKTDILNFKGKIICY